MSDREKVINDLQMQIEELEERLAIALEGQPEIVRCKDCKHRGNSEKCVLAAISKKKISHCLCSITVVIGSALTGNENDDLS